MIISASRRTDIPAYYSTWFINRLREGFLCVRNPMNPHQVSRVSLARDVLDCIVFWTKNAAPMLDKLDALQDYTYYFQFTLTGYGRDIEAHLPDKKAQLIPTFQKLSDAIGPERVITCTAFQREFDPPRRFLRIDPFDNQSGEIEYEDRGLGSRERRSRRENLGSEVL